MEAKEDTVKDTVTGCNAGTGKDEAVTIAITSSDTSKLTINSPGSITVTGCAENNAKTIGYQIPANATPGKVTITGMASGGKLTSNGKNTGTFIAGSFEVVIGSAEKTTPTINWSNPSAITYGTKLSETQLNATASVAGTLVAGTLAYNPPLGTVLDAGTRTLSVFFTPTDTMTYNSASRDVTLNVNKADATVTLGGLDPTFDGDAKAATATTTVAGTSSFTFAYSQGTGEDKTTVASPTNAGSYGVVATLVDDNYQGSASGVLTIAKASTMTTVSCTGPFTYNGSAQTSCSASVTGAGGLNQSLTVNYQNNTNAGDATASASYAESTNHLGSSDTKNFQIDRANATINVPSGTLTFVFDGTPKGITGTATGVGDVDLTSLLNLGNSFSNVGTHTANWSFNGGTNYNNANDSVQIKIVYTATAGRTYLQPINTNGNRSQFKAGSTIPVKFQLFMADGVTPVSTAVATISVTKTGSGTSGESEDSVTLPADRGSTFRYDSIDRQYIFNLGTAKTWSGTYRITTTLDDGTIISQEVAIAK
jgi:hypothetical protein